MKQILSQKINSKIQYYTLDCICYMYDLLNEVELKNSLNIAHTNGSLAFRNVIDLLIIDFKKKLISKTNSDKPIKISLHYYQAVFLVAFIEANYNEFEGVLEKNLLRRYKEELQQNFIGKDENIYNNT